MVTPRVRTGIVSSVIGAGIRAVIGEVRIGSIVDGLQVASGVVIRVVPCSVVVSLGPIESIRRIDTAVVRDGACTGVVVAIVCKAVLISIVFSIKPICIVPCIPEPRKLLPLLIAMAIPIVSITTKFLLAPNCHNEALLK